MKSLQTKKLVLAGVLTAVAVVGSLFSFPVLGSKCSPVQHMVNILCGVFLGPGYGVASAFLASLLRNMMGLGSLLAFPGSMVGALCCGLLYKKTNNLLAALAGEVVGTGILGGFCAWPVAILLMGQSASSVPLTAYLVPFLVSTTGGAVIAGLALFTMKNGGLLGNMQHQLER